MNIATESPAWLIIFCLLAGLAYSALLYYKNKKEEFNALTLGILSAFRFIAVAVIAFLLLSPMLKSHFRNFEKPILILAQDNSESLIIGKDSAFYRNDYPKEFLKLVDELQKEYTVRTYNFGHKVSEELTFDYTDQQTDISELFEEINTRYSNRNVGGMLLATDGLYNRGINPVYSAEKLKFPIFAVALGDTSVRKDIFIRKINYNRIAFKGNEFPIEAIVGANLCNEENSILTVSHGGAILFSKNINFNSNHFNETVHITLNAEKAGLQRYRISVRPIEGEISSQNNSQDIFIEVLDTKQKIIILSQSPHPDIAALKEAIESNWAYEVTHSLSNQFSGNIGEYNLIILHQLPGGRDDISRIIAEANKQAVPLLFILGSQSNLVQFNKSGAGIEIQAQKELFNESLPSLNKEFSLFTISDDVLKAIEMFPPLIAPFGEIKTQVSANTLFNQQIGSLVTGYPLIVFNQTLDNKTGVIAGEGIWRWRLINFQKYGNHNAFNELLSKIIQYLAVKADKSFFRVTGQNIFMENEAIHLDAEVYNQSYELINTPDVEITLKNSVGDTYNFLFGKTSNAYQLNAGILPIEDYTYEATVRVGEKLYHSQGEFTVSPVNIEAINTVADHNLLYRLTSKYQGELIYPEQLSTFTKMIKARDDVRTVVYTEKKFSGLVNIFGIFIFIVALLTAEWFIRKRSGSY
ncbi:MAG TPA: hypothetical protein PK259_05040 [Bacteroidales bacterium]|nr:hypothetical protein [Bacteroidales bacterium]